MEGIVFETERLVAREWHEAERVGVVEDLPTIVAGMLTASVTRWLPPSWQGSYTCARASEWIAEQDAEGSVLLVVSHEGGESVGLVLLFEEQADDGVDVRLGYLLAEEAWGRGLGGELLSGIVAWCRGRPEVRSIIGGVARGNTASIRLLERHGFVRDDRATPDDDLTYRLAIGR